MASNFGKNVQYSIFGQSHGAAIGVVIDGLPAGERVDMERLNAFMARRAPGQNAWSTKRKEADQPEILSGLVDGVTCGAPLTAIIRNTDTRSKDYSALKVLPRPGHADYTAQLRYGGFQDVRGGGHFSGRLTAPLCIAGGIAMQILERRGVYIGGHIASIGSVQDVPFDPVSVNVPVMQAVWQREFPVNDTYAGEKMKQQIEAAFREADSIGGVVECCAIGMPGGVGNPMFDGVENRLAQAFFGIPAVKGVEFGEGFKAATLRGSRHNDPFTVENGKIVTTTNHHGGILGGITSGMPILVRIAFKPTPSIGQQQSTVDLEKGKEAALTITGRHDPCIVPRAVPVVEAVMAMVLLDLLEGKS